jgi:hypothetical protein
MKGHKLGAKTFIVVGLRSMTNKYLITKYGQCLSNRSGTSEGHMDTNRPMALNKVSAFGGGRLVLCNHNTLRTCVTNLQGEACFLCPLTHFLLNFIGSTHHHVIYIFKYI